MMNATSRGAGPRIRRASLLAVAGALSVALAACSGPGSAAPVGDDEVVSLKVLRGNASFESVILADEKGYFTDAKLDPTIEVAQGASPTISAVVSGEADVALTDAVAAVRAVQEGIPITVVAGSRHADVDSVDQSEGVLLPPGSTVKGWGDLAGTAVGVADLGGVGQVMIQQALAQNGVDPGSVDFVALPPPSLAEAARSGEVAAVFLFTSFYFDAIDAGFTNLGTGVKEFLPNAPQSVWISSTSFAQQNPQALDRFRQGLSEAGEYAIANPDEVRRIYHENTQLPAAFIDERMVMTPLWVEMPRDGWDVLLTALKSDGQIADSLSYEDVVWEGARG